MRNTGNPESISEKPGNTSESPVIQIADSVKDNITAGRDNFTLRLKPEGLGNVTVTMSFKKEKIEMRIKSDTAMTKELIATQLGELKNELESSGYKIDTLNVESQPHQQTLSDPNTGSYSHQRRDTEYRGSENENGKRKNLYESDETSNRIPPQLIHKNRTISYKI
ncbi:hypothetical protein SDC9_159965 [bioreactor metagenome]|uniref:Flagellar hook-length control protein-like C-terminal domain-containing protein n=1 Tax=bioreactor metagenome TaxID=1076179 RepID=A0A645FGA9_9ZZZZ